MSLSSFPIFRNEETEAQRSKGSSPGSHSEFAYVTQTKAQFAFPVLCHHPEIISRRCVQTLKQMCEPLLPFWLLLTLALFRNGPSIICLLGCLGAPHRAFFMGSCLKGPDSFLAMIDCISVHACLCMRDVGISPRC